MTFPARRPRFPYARFLVLAAGLAAFLALAGPGLAENWPGWRGPTGSGYSAEKDLPLTWGGKDNANVLWKATLPGRGSSSPIAWGGRVFVTSAAQQSEQEVKQKVVPEHYVTCYQAADRKQLWSTTVPKGTFADGYYSIPTPVTDGKRLYAWFGSGVAVALDFDGRIVWRRERPGPYNVYPGVSSSPVLHGDLLLILVDQGKDSFLLALDKNTGDVKWERKRTDVRGSTNSTPVLIEVKGRAQMVVAGSNALQGLDPDDGKVLWWCGKDGGYWTSLTAGSGLVYTDSGGGRGLAVDPGGSGDVSKTHVKWQHAKVPEGLGSPVIVGDYLYRVHKPGVLKCWKLSTGEVVFDEKLEGISFLASPIATPDGRLYFASPGRSYVIKAGVPKLEVLADNKLKDAGDDGPSPAASGGRLFLKSASQLWCVGKK
jgi:outer membrane protein assembly factor BamB